MAILASDLSSFSEAAFINTDPGLSGSMCLLVSGSFTPNNLNSGSWQPGSWNWNDPSNPTTGSLVTGSTLIGITVSNLDSNRANNLINFKLCKKLVFTAQMGTNEQQFVLDIIDKKFFPSYTYFKVNSSIDLDSLTGIGIYFTSASVSGSDIYEDYVCEDAGGVRSIGISPYFSAEETSNFNPIINNVTGSVFNSRTKKVEALYTEIWTRTEEQVLDVDNPIDGGYASFTLVQTYNGGSASSVYDPDVDSNIDGVDAGYTILEVLQEQCTVPATIPDSFYTQVGNISGRYLGSKNNLYTKYIGYKEVFTEKNLEILSGSVVIYDSASVIETGKDRAFFEATSFTGSVYSSGSLDEAIAAVGLSNMQLSVLAFTQGVQYSASFRSITKPSGSAGTPMITVTGTRQSIIVPKMGTLPEIGDIIFADTKYSHRLTEARIYSPDLNKILVTDIKGHVTQMVDVSS